MTTADDTVEALQTGISELKSRVDELSFENEFLRNLCVANGIKYEEMLAAHRHRCRFARLRADHPVEEAVSVADALDALPIGRQIALFSGNLPGFALASRKI